LAPMLALLRARGSKPPTLWLSIGQHDLNGARTWHASDVCSRAQRYQRARASAPLIWGEHSDYFLGSNDVRLKYRAWLKLYVVRQIRSTANEVTGVTVRRGSTHGLAIPKICSHHTRSAGQPRQEGRERNLW